MPSSKLPEYLSDNDDSQYLISNTRLAQKFIQPPTLEIQSSIIQSSKDSNEIHQNKLLGEKF